MHNHAAEYTSDIRQAFDLFIADFGGPLRVANPADFEADPFLGHSLRTCWERFNHFAGLRNGLDKELSFYMGYAHSPIPNAIAGRERDTYMLAACGGLPVTLRKLCGLLFSRNDTFRKIGDPSLETEKYKWEVIGNVIHTDALPLNGPSVSGFLPNCDIRADAMFYSFHSAMQYVWAHEFSHILGGHVDLIQDKWHATDIQEMRTSSQESTLEYQALELDADNSAISVLAQWIDNGQEILTADFKLSKQERLSLFVFSVAVVLWIWWLDWGNNSLSDESATHPNPLFRFHNLMFTILQMDEHGMLGSCSGKEALDFAIDELFSIYGNMRLLGVFAGAGSDVYMQKSYERIRAAWDHLLPMQDELLKRCYVEGRVFLVE